MGNWGWLLIGLGSCWSLACTGGESGTAGGQSGTEAAIPACAKLQDNEIGLDDSTQFGSGRQLFVDAMAFSMQPTSMHSSSPTDSSSFDTLVTYGLSGAPTHAVYTADPAPSCAGHGWSLSVDGVILHFESADGAFNESVSGSLYRWHPDGYAPQVPQFVGHPDTPFNGTYDIDSAITKAAQHTVWLEAPMGPGGGALGLQDGGEAFFTLASWVNVTSGAGVGGSGNANYGGTAGSADTGFGGKDGSGGTIAMGNDRGDGGAAGTVPTAGTDASGAPDRAGSGGSN